MKPEVNQEFNKIIENNNKVINLMSEMDIDKEVMKNIRKWNEDFIELVTGQHEAIKTLMALNTQLLEEIKRLENELDERG